MKSEPYLIHHISKTYFRSDKCHNCERKILKHVNNCIEKHLHDFGIEFSLMRPKNPQIIGLTTLYLSTYVY